MLTGAPHACDEPRLAPAFDPAYASVASLAVGRLQRMLQRHSLNRLASDGSCDALVHFWGVRSAILL